MEKLIDIGSGPVASFLSILIKDKSTRNNIIWATDTYQELGLGFSDTEQMNKKLLFLHSEIIKPRIQKSQEAQAERTRKIKQIANRIVWNIWQMDGLKDTVPLGKPREEYHQMSLFETVPEMTETEEEPGAIPCRIYNWRSNESMLFRDLKED